MSVLCMLHLDKLVAGFISAFCLTCLTCCDCCYLLSYLRKVMLEHMLTDFETKQNVTVGQSGLIYPLQSGEEC